MTIDPTTATAAQQTPATPALAAASGDALLSSDFQTFLTLLTTQLQNQDPLNPLESTDFAVQLATFSGVEQQVRTNDLLRDVMSTLAAGGIGQLAGWVGMEARVPGPARFDGTPIRLAPEPDPASDAATLVVTDATGREVSREAVPLTADQLLWAGADASGTPLPPGDYSFALESLSSGEVTSSRPVETYALVREARQGPAGTEIVVGGGRVVATADVTALRAPD